MSRHSQGEPSHCFREKAKPQSTGPEPPLSQPSCLAGLSLVRGYMSPLVRSQSSSSVPGLALFSFSSLVKCHPRSLFSRACPPWALPPVTPLTSCCFYTLHKHFLLFKVTLFVAPSLPCLLVPDFGECKLRVNGEPCFCSLPCPPALRTVPGQTDESKYWLCELRHLLPTNPQNRLSLLIFSSCPPRRVEQISTLLAKVSLYMRAVSPALWSKARLRS